MLSKLFSSLLFSLLSIGFKPVYSQLRCYTLQAPVNIISGMRHIALVDFNGDDKYGELLSSSITSYLLEDYRGIEEDNNYHNYLGAKTNIYTILEREKIEEVMSEHRLAAAGILESDNAILIGGLLGVDHFLIGNLSLVSDIKTSINRGSHFNSSGKEVHTKTHSKWRQTDATATIKVVSTQTGKIISVVTKTFTTVTSTSLMSKSKKRDIGIARTKVYQKAKRFPSDSKLESAHSAKTRAIDYLAHQLVNAFVPKYIEIKFRFEKSKNSAYKAEVKKGKKALDNADINTVYNLLQDIMQQNESDEAIVHNLAIVYEAVGSYDKALKYHAYAARIGQSKKYDKDLMRCKEQKADFEALSASGLNLVPHDFNNSIATNSSIKVIIKGRSSVNVYSDMLSSSNVVTEVMGGKTYDVLETKGNWLKILVPGLDGDVSGYIKTTEIKE